MKFNLSKCEGFSTHRSGWSYAIQSLKPFHATNGIFFDDFIERKFIWNAHKDNSYYKFPWVGIVHLPKHNRVEFGVKNSLDFLCSQPNFQKSLKKCLCLITLSKDLKDCVQTALSDYNIPIITVKYPTEKSLINWNPSKFLSNPSITQLGYWLRDFQKFHNDAERIRQNNPKIETYCMPGDIYEYKRIWSNIINQYGIINYHEPINLKNDEFDNHLSKTLAWCCFHQTSANTAIVESIIRNTPIFTNKLPATVEYLGENYPLYNDSDLIDDNGFIKKQRILEAHEYIKSMDKTDLSGEFFANDLIKKLNNLLQ